VWAAAGREDALWIMDQAMLSWQQIETLADSWKVRMNNNRRVPVSIVVDDQVPRSKHSPVPYLHDDSNSIKIFLNNIGPCVTNFRSITPVAKVGCT